jgi:hypothetical protein
MEQEQPAVPFRVEHAMDLIMRQPDKACGRRTSQRLR